MDNSGDFPVCVRAKEWVKGWVKRLEDGLAGGLEM